MVQATPTDIPIIDASDIIWFGVATKTKSIKAKPLNAILIAPGALEKFLLDTIEGVQVLKANSVVCIGELNDAWQQDKKKLFDKYDVVRIDDDGWMICCPKPDNEINWAQPDPLGQCSDRGFAIKGQWGKEYIVDGRQCFLQFGQQGDFIAQNQKDMDDIWIIGKGIMNSTYDRKEFT